jgi:hypothetical protein
MTLLEAFAELLAPRATNKRYPSPLMAFIVVCTVLCGAENSINPLTLKLTRSPLISFEGDRG